MAIVSKLMVRGAILGTNTLHYTAPALGKGIVKSVNFCNTHTSNVTVSLYFVNAGDSAGVTNIVYKDLTLAPNETKSEGRFSVLNGAGMIYAIASTASVVALEISGYEE